MYKIYNFASYYHILNFGWVISSLLRPANIYWMQYLGNINRTLFSFYEYMPKKSLAHFCFFFIFLILIFRFLFSVQQLGSPSSILEKTNQTSGKLMRSTGWSMAQKSSFWYHFTPKLWTSLASQRNDHRRKVQKMWDE